MRWTRYVAVGDSFTEGLEDPRPEGRHRGWADRLAEQLAHHQPSLHYANLAVRGRRLPQIVGEQIPQALTLRPDLISIAAGVNDALRPRWDSQRSADLLRQGVTEARASGADVLLISFGNPSRRSRALSTVTNRLRDYREHLLEIGEQTGAIVLDMWHETVFDDPRFWAEDRLHLNPLGHERMAGAAAHALGLPAADWRSPLTHARAASVLQGLRGDVTWTANHFAPWVGRHLLGRSSGDGVDPKRPMLAPVSQTVRVTQVPGPGAAAPHRRATATHSTSPSHASGSASPTPNRESVPGRPAPAGESVGGASKPVHESVPGSPASLPESPRIVSLRPIVQLRDRLARRVDR